jgi:outer membrane protein assembly factor BamB/ABC-type phosphate/phosphonate transport system substrate-binding protein
MIRQLLLLGFAFAFYLSSAMCLAKEKPLTIAVMDPLAKPLSCACVQGHAQRDYEKLGTYLEKELKRPVKVLFAESLSKINKMADSPIDLVVGKMSVVKFDVGIANLSVHEIAMLTDKQGKTTFTGLFVVPQADRAKKIDDLDGYKILFGPPDCDEKFQAAADALAGAGIAIPEDMETRPGCSDSVVEMLEKSGTRTAAVISSYAAALLEGCGTIKKDAIRIVGETEPVPFVAVFAADSMSENESKTILDALARVKDDPELLKALESKSGFVAVEKKKTKKKKKSDAQDKSKKSDCTSTDPSSSAWPGWRGLHRDGLVAQLPAQLPKKPKLLWSKPLNTAGLAGIAVAGKHVLVADRNASDEFDVFHCFDAESGEELWVHQYFTSGAVKDYGNSPRATPLILDGRVYTLGALGDLHCVDLSSGMPIWKKSFVDDFAGVVPTWGYCSSPLAVDGMLIVNPGSPDASLVALDLLTGKEIWRSPGLPSSYSSFIAGKFGGVRQIVGYDEKSLGGWDIASGKRLWTLVPPVAGDFNVPTPIDAGGKLIVVTENNGARLYGFESDGAISSEPLAQHEDLKPDSSTPVLSGGKLFGCRDKLFCLDASEFKVHWTGDQGTFCGYASLIASKNRVLIATHNGELILVDASAAKFKLISRVRIFPEDAELLSHPALVGTRLYLQGDNCILCLDLAAEEK